MTEAASAPDKGTSGTITAAAVFAQALAEVSHSTRLLDSLVKPFSARGSLEVIMALSAKPVTKASDHVKALYYVMQSMEVKCCSACPDHPGPSA